eukprot:TRINITY_DN27037_c0_g1_i1.p1 TRINITY_DN27037_c0_g1~~TRINITY_DN27037_c0_g1_i1.p1  ORF type:complete len:409 (-),score=47.01 TRINITY_DN27037_c0_g1_i1:536-1735(-)
MAEPTQLSSVLLQLDLPDLVVPAQRWCEETSTSHLNEVCDNFEDFVKALQLKPDERDRIKVGLMQMELSVDVADISKVCTSPVPLDEDGFCASFLASEEKNIKAFFDHFGFVVVREVLTREQCDGTVAEFWDRHRALGAEQYRPDTWDQLWSAPCAKRFSFAGIIGLWSDMESLQQLENRQCSGVYDAFRSILGESSLIVDYDRLGVMRPTVAVPFESGPVDRPEWRTKSNWLHLDCNPHSAGEGKGYASIGSFRHTGDHVDFTKSLLTQGLLSLTDAREADGGFHCVPCGHRLALDWARSHESCGTRDNIQVPDDDILQSMVHPVPLRKGSLLVWNSLLFHGNRPNNSSRFRVVQYLRMFPADMPYQPLLGESDRHLLPETFVVSPLGEKLFGFAKWD